jgi:hypothetical protein
VKTKVLYQITAPHANRSLRDAYARVEESVQNVRDEIHNLINKSAENDDRSDNRQIRGMDRVY